MVLSSCTLAVIYNWSLVLWIIFVYMGDWREYEISSFGNIKLVMKLMSVNMKLTNHSLPLHWPSVGWKRAPPNLHCPSSSQWSFIQLCFNFSASFHNLLSSKVINGQIFYTLIKIPFLMNSLIECKSLCALLILKCKDNCNGQHEKGLIIACRLLWILIGLIA